jgi:hypothetical protein
VTPYRHVEGFFVLIKHGDSGREDRNQKGCIASMASESTTQNLLNPWPWRDCS